MTTVPGIEGETIHLICNACGNTLRVPNTLCDSEVVWPILTANDWNGSPFAAGPHWCPRCDSEAAHTPIEPSEAAAESSDRESAQEHPSCQANIHQLSEATLVTITGDIHQPQMDLMREVLAAAVAAGRNIIVDLKEVNVLDSASLSALVRAYGDIRLRGRSLCLVAPSRFVQVVLHTMHLDRAIATFDDRASALAWLRSHTPGRSHPRPNGSAHAFQKYSGQIRPQKDTSGHMTSPGRDQSARGPGR